MKKLTIDFTRSERLLGWIYMALQLLVLPNLLFLCNELLTAPLTDAQINFVFFALNFLCVTIIFRKYLMENLKLFFSRFLRGISAVCIGLVGYWALNLLLANMIMLVYPEFTNVNDTSINSMVQENFHLMAIGTIVLVPITEELLYRGLIFRGLYNRSHFWAYTVSTIAFCLPHVIGYIGLYDPVHLLLCFLQYIPAGLCLGWAYSRTDSIFAPTLMHMLINLLGVMAMR